MQKGLAVLFLALLAVSCPAQESLPSWDANTQKAWWSRNPTSDLWPKAAETLQAQLEANYKQNGSRCFSNTDFQGWLDHLEWVRLGLDCPDVLANADDLKTFIALGQDESVSHLFVEKLDPHDVRKEALQNLVKLSQANADELHEYAALGVAYALVFDQPFPRYWPHSQVARTAVPIGDVDVVQRFKFYVQSNRDKKLDLDLTQLSFENLKYLVDSEVKLSEFEYAQKNRISYSHFADAFFSINYVTTRIAGENTVYNWPNPTYTLADIEMSGGICVDQAYYAETLGKGRGIPTIRFNGLGAWGGHAWFGYLSRGGKWELDCGRYESQNFPKGFAVDPQTWQKIDDATLTNLFKNGAQNSNYQPEMTALAWAYLHQNDPSYRQILEDARAIMPEWAGTWRLESAWLEKNHTEIDEKKKFYEQWITQFTSYPEMKVAGQQHLLDILKQANDPEAQSLQQSIVLANRSEGFDLGISGSASAIDEKIKAQDWDGAKLEYEKAIRDFGDQGGATLFNTVIFTYVTNCLKAGQTVQAEHGIKFAEDRMAFDTDSQVGLNFSHLKDEVEAQKKGDASK